MDLDIRFRSLHLESFSKLRIEIFKIIRNEPKTLNLESEIQVPSIPF